MSKSLYSTSSKKIQWFCRYDFVNVTLFRQQLTSLNSEISSFQAFKYQASHELWYLHSNVHSLIGISWLLSLTAENSGISRLNGNLRIHGTDVLFANKRCLPVELGRVLGKICLKKSLSAVEWKIMKVLRNFEGSQGSNGSICKKLGSFL